jgi:hypothetical protein
MVFILANEKEYHNRFCVRYPLYIYHSAEDWCGEWKKGVEEK